MSKTVSSLKRSLPKVGELTGIGGVEGEPAYLSTPPVYEDGLLKELTFGNGVRSVYDYDNNGRLTGIAHQKGTEEIAGFRYQYDNANNVTYRNDNSYQYDVLNQLTRAYVSCIPEIYNDGTVTPSA